MQYWDTAGQELYQTITQTYYKGALGIVLCYSVVDRKSFLNVKSWAKQIEIHGGKHTARILVANKIDLPKDEHVVTEEEGKELAE
jgi:small GTP-binding protein